MAARAEESDSAIQDMNLTLTDDYIEKVLDRLEKIVSPPVIDLCKSISHKT